MRGHSLFRWARGALDSRYVLPAGALLGLAMAVIGAFAPRPGTPPKDAAALVNGIPIAAADHGRVIEALAAGKRNPLDTDDRTYALERLIDEELLIQRAVELGLQRSDAPARKRLVTAMLNWIANDAAEPPTEEALREFHAQNLDLFTATARIEATWFHIARSSAGGATLAERARRRLDEGLPFDRAAAEFGSPSALRLPAGLLPPAKLRDYLGPSLTREALSLEPGTAAGPIARADGWHFLLVHRRETAPPPAFEDVRTEVAAEFARRQADEAVRRYLDWLRRRADIVIAGNGRK